MRVLWTSLVEFPPLAKYLGKEVPAHCGWLYSSAVSALKQTQDLKLGVLVYSSGSQFEHHTVEGIEYYLIPCAKISKVSKRQIKSCVLALKDFQPDLIHIHGTEHSLAAAVCQANGSGIPMVANIQGLAIPYTRYADGGISFIDKLVNITPLDFYRGTFMLNAKRSFKRRSECERLCIQSVGHIIGRTQWDYDHAVTINPGIRYHFMNETLRDSFYDGTAWEYDKCRKHSIFVSNSGSPLKGAHNMLLALKIILRQFPDTVVRFCGSSVMNNDFKSLLKMQGYHLYLRRLVRKLGLKSNVEFLGSLSERQMKQAFLEANVYVLPSAIENSPNSLCEAQILGVPAVAAYVGGVPSLVKDGETGFLYRYEETEMLAQIIMRLFHQSDLSELSDKERLSAAERHDKTTNAFQLADIYCQILQGC